LRARGEVIETVSVGLVRCRRIVLALAMIVTIELIWWGRCENGLSVETTAWEGWKAKQNKSAA
jgi:hypothetical protein